MEKREYTYSDIVKIEVKGEMVVFTFKDGEVAGYPERDLVALNDFFKLKSSERVN